MGLTHILTFMGSEDPTELGSSLFFALNLYYAGNTIVPLKRSNPPTSRAAFVHRP